MNLSIDAMKILLGIFGIIGVFFVILIYYKIKKDDKNYFWYGIFLISLGVLFIALFTTPEVAIGLMKGDFAKLTPSEKFNLKSYFLIYQAIFLFLYIAVGANMVSYSLTTNREKIINNIYLENTVDSLSNELISIKKSINVIIILLIILIILVSLNYL